MQLPDHNKIPLLQVFLQQNKLSQLIKIMLNQTISKQLLKQYGQITQALSEQQKFKNNNTLQRFNIKQLIQLKGSDVRRVRQYENVPLLRLLQKKIYQETLTNETRKKFWVQFTEILQKPNFYNDLKQLQLATDFQVDIEKDINRTYKSAKVKVKTKQVLGVFAQYNPYIGYCQGMNSIIAFLIDDDFTCQQAFFIFKRITQVILPCDYYNSMDSIMIYMRIFYQMLNVTHNSCYTRMKQISKQQMQNSYIVMISFVLQWFVCLFCNETINIQITRIIWDFLLIQGPIILFKAALAFFDFLQPYILKCKSFCTHIHYLEQYNQMQKNYVHLITDADYIKNKIKTIYIDPHFLFLLKEKLSQQKNKQNKSNQSQLEIDKKKDKKYYIRKCNKKWNACFQVLENNLKNHYLYDFFVFKTSDNLNIVNDYLQKLHKQYFNKQKATNLTDNLLIGRIPHICHTDTDQITQDSISNRNKSDNSTQSRQQIIEHHQNQEPKNIQIENIRKKQIQKIHTLLKNQHSLQKSPSIMFMADMVRNCSYNNLQEIYDVDQMFR